MATHRGTRHNQSQHFYPGICEGGARRDGTSSNASFNTVIFNDSDENINRGFRQEFQAHGRQQRLLDLYAYRSVLGILYRGMSISGTVESLRTQLTRMGALRFLQEKGANLTSTFSLPFSLYVVVLDCRGPYLEGNA